MPRHFRTSRRSRRPTLPLEEIDSPPQVAHLHINLQSVASHAPARDNRPLGTELKQLRARLLRMIMENESVRRTRKFPR